MNIQITDVTVESDNLFVTGTVDGIRSRGHGWVARTNSMTPEQILQYQEELLINGRPADLSALKSTISAPAITPQPAPQLVWLRNNWLPLSLAVANALLTVAMHFIH